MFLIARRPPCINVSRDRLSTDVQLVFKIRESERIGFSKEYSVPTTRLLILKKITTLASERKNRLIWLLNNFERDWPCVGMDT